MGGRTFGHYVSGWTGCPHRTSEEITYDVPAGFTTDGFDAWIWQDASAVDMTIGAPPDAFSTEGQAWGLPPFVPERLRAEDPVDYDSVIEPIYLPLVSSPSVMVVVLMEDGLGSEERLNYPEAGRSELNWLLALSSPLEDWCHAPLHAP